MTMSVSAALARHVRLTFSPSRTIKPLINSISVRRPFCMSCPMEGRYPLAVRLLSLKRCSSQARIGPLVALAGTRYRLGRQMQNLLQLIALRLPDTDRFAAEPDGEAGGSAHFATSRRRSDRCARRAHCPWRSPPASTSARPTDCRLPWRYRHTPPAGKSPPPAA